MPKTPNGKLDRKSIAALLLRNAKRDMNGVVNDVEKMTVREGELRLLWERVLPTLGDLRLGPSSDFFMCGGNSMLLMKLQKAIKETTGIRVSTKDLYESSTLRAMTHCVFDRANRADDDAAPIDWAVETSLPASLQTQIQDLATSSPPEAGGHGTNGTEVLLTGATSFLGSHLLRSLLSSPRVKKVHCVAVPADEQATLFSHDTRIVCYSGTLLSPTLGVTPQERRTLEQSVHVIVHAGAHGHCLNRFDSLRAPNLQSLHFLATLALPRCVTILFLSSSRVVLLSGDTAPAPASMRSYPPAVDGKDGYTASKWAGEVFLENLVAHVENVASSASSPSVFWRSSLNVEVHRACTLVSESAPNSDAMNAILRHSLDMRCAPRLERAEGYLDFAPMESIVAKITVHAVEMATAVQQQQQQQQRQSQPPRDDAADGSPTERARGLRIAITLAVSSRPWATLGRIWRGRMVGDPKNWIYKSGL
uniref:Polyketide synthase-related protein Dhc1 n=1 Tax=Alternaria cinerariae TaxID=216837 RepID=DHC1_ALTCI|nr:RecName: Full=Polyketide synthase-related protein Dhc1; AltName: Full=Dehydrocurvularin biosynthesis protein 1 [Alternaria cinerariae]AKQ49199.1 putative PKS-NRPKS [Alternaria cinerariae]